MQGGQKATENGFQSVKLSSRPQDRKPPNAHPLLILVVAHAYDFSPSQAHQREPG